MATKLNPIHSKYFDPHNIPPEGRIVHNSDTSVFLFPRSKDEAKKPRGVKHILRDIVKHGQKVQEEQFLSVYQTFGKLRFPPSLPPRFSHQRLKRANRKNSMICAAISPLKIYRHVPPTPADWNVSVRFRFEEFEYYPYEIAHDMFLNVKPESVFDDRRENVPIGHLFWHNKGRFLNLSSNTFIYHKERGYHSPCSLVLGEDKGFYFDGLMLNNKSITNINQHDYVFICPPAVQRYFQTHAMIKHEEKQWLSWRNALECAGPPDKNYWSFNTGKKELRNALSSIRPVALTLILHVSSQSLDIFRKIEEKIIEICALVSRADNVKIQVTFTISNDFKQYKAHMDINSYHPS